MGRPVTDKKNPKAPNRGKRLARLAAVQGLYRMGLTEHKAAQIISDFRERPSEFIAEADDPNTMKEVDLELFSEILKGVTTHKVVIDEMMTAACSEKVSQKRLEALLKAILQAGIYELYRKSEVPTGVIINDYVDVAHAFFNGKEPGLVNGLLDKLAKKLRS